MGGKTNRGIEDNTDLLPLESREDRESELKYSEFPNGMVGIEGKGWGKGLEAFDGLVRRHVRAESPFT